jgi:adenosylhomocysteine nucleosidase
MIGIICAMEIELEAIKSLAQDAEEISIGYFNFTKCTVYGKKTVLCVCGIGKVFAALCCQTMILTFSPDIIINVGVGGNLTSSLKIGDITVADGLIQHDMDTSPLGDPPGLISGINIIRFDCDKNTVNTLCSICDELGITYSKGIIATGDRFVASKEEKQRIVQTFNAVSCDMEGCAIAQACYISKIPFAAIRAISDDADNGSPDDYPEFCRTSAKKSAELMKEFIKRY